MKDIGQLLREAAREGGRPLRPADDFWRDFRRQAANVPQSAEVPVKIGLSRRKKIWLGLAGPAVAIAATLVAVFWSGAGHHATHDAVQSYQVGEDVVHGGVMILNDEPSRATILWIADLADNV